MSSAKRDVIVYRQGRRVETLTSRPIRLLPSNVAGVVYAGEVYPLHVGDHIDLDDTPEKKALCMRFVAPGASIPYVAAPTKASKPKKASLLIDRWNVESNRFGNYVVFDATPLMAQKFTKALADAGLGVRRWDESIRAADDGHFYDYFARLEFDGTREQTMARVRSILGDTKAAAAAGVVRTSSPATESPSEADILALVERAVEETFGPKLREAHAAAERLQYELDDATAQAQRGRLAMKRVDELQADLRAAHKEAQTKEKQLSARAARWQNKTKELRLSNAQLQALLDDAKSRAVSSADAREQVRSANDAKQEAIDQWLSASEEAEVWEAEAERLESQLAEVRSQLEAERSRSSYLEEQRSNAALELNERRDEVRERRRALQLTGGPQQGNLEALIGRLLPRVDLDPEAIDCLLDWPNPWPALQVLRQLDQGLTPEKQRSVEGKKRWREVFKINTGHAGQSDRGRIYWAPTSENRVLVYLHWKEDDKEQDRFIRNLPERL